MNKNCLSYIKFFVIYLEYLIIQTSKNQLLHSFSMTESPSSIRQLQLKIEDQNDQIEDIYTVIHLNLSTIKLEHDTFFKNQKRSTLNSSINLLNTIKKINQQCSNIRLNLLITQQISHEQLTLRKQRLNQYEQKIQEQRRLISDKEQNYQSLITFKRKRAPQMTPQQFEQLKTEIKFRENSRCCDELSSKYQQIKTMNKLTIRQNEKLKKQKQLLYHHKFKIKSKIQHLEKKLRKFQVYQSYLNTKNIQNIPILNIDYKSIKSYNKKTIQKEIIKNSRAQGTLPIYKSIFQQQQENQRLLKKVNDQIQMTEYLQLQNKNLVRKYQKQQKIKQKQINNQNYLKKQKNIFSQKIDIADIMSV